MARENVFAVLKLRCEDSNETWTPILTGLCHAVDVERTRLESSDCLEILYLLSAKLMRETAVVIGSSIQHDTGTESGMTRILDCIRLLLRQREDMPACAASELMGQLVSIACNTNCYHSEIKQNAVRCLINLLFDNERNTLCFCSTPVDGVAALVAALSNAGCGKAVNSYREISDETHFYMTRLLYMMVSQW